MTKTEQMRLTAWRLRVLRCAAASPRGVAQTCRHFGISRKSFYKWKRRLAEYGEAGLADRPRTPRHSPRSTPSDVVRKILYLRQQFRFGPSLITSYLRRFHQVSVSQSTVHRMLVKHGMNRSLAHQPRHGRKWQRYEKAQPGHRLQVDVKFLERIAGSSKRLYQFTAIDDCTRIRILKVYDACNQETAMRFIDDVLRRLPFRVLVVQTDNGAEFQSKFHWHVEWWRKTNQATRVL